MTLINTFARGVLVAPDRVFLDQPGRSWTYREAAATVDALAARLIARGVTPTTPVATLSPNDSGTFLCVLAILRAGAVWVPLNLRNHAATSAGYCRRTGTGLVLVHETARDQAAAIARETGGDLLPVAELLAEAAETPAAGALPVVTGDHLAVLMPTGGTTGEPKAARLTHRSFDTFVANLLGALPTADGEAVHLMAAPMTHAAGFLALALMATGARNVVLDRIDPGEVLATIESAGVTHVFLPPTVIYLLLAHAELASYDYRSLRHLVYAGAPMSVARLREAIAAFGPVMTQTFGQAEAPMAATCLSPAEHARALAEAPERLASCGRPTLLTELAVLDDAGRPVGHGETGEIAVRGDLVMAGYLGDPDRPRHEWHRTGDVGRQDDAGYVYITDRKRDMIISGGFNLYPGEIEQAIWLHPAVQDCAVVGVPDEKWGEAVTAVVQLKAGAEAAADEIRALVREQLGGMKTPKRVEFWDDLPRSAVGKVLRRAVRDVFWSGQERAV